MRRVPWLLVFLTALLTACGGGGGGFVDPDAREPNDDVATCSPTTLDFLATDPSASAQWE